MNYIPTTVRDHFIEKQGNACGNHPVVPIAELALSREVGLANYA
jgi:hypothetical protein